MAKIKDIFKNVTSDFLTDLFGTMGMGPKKREMTTIWRSCKDMRQDKIGKRRRIR